MMGEGPRFSLQGCTALVTGAGGDIGRAIAAELARRGVSIGVVGQRRSNLLRTVRQLESAAEHEIFVTDLRDELALRRTARAYLRRYGRLDILVHSNGIYAAGSLDQAPLRDFDRLWASNVRSPFFLTQLFLPALRESSGQVLFVNSSSGTGTRPGVGQFSATQHALRSLADTFRAELNAEGVRVLSVFPGRTATERQRRIFEREGRKYVPDRLLQPEDIGQAVVDLISLPRTAEVTDLWIRPAAKP